MEAKSYRGMVNGNIAVRGVGDDCSLFAPYIPRSCCVKLSFVLCLTCWIIQLYALTKCELETLKKKEKELVEELNTYKDKVHFRQFVTIGKQGNISSNISSKKERL